MPNKKEYYPRANALKRLHRRPSILSEVPCEEFESYKNEPTIDELKDALTKVKDSSEGIWRLAALMDNLATYNSPRYTDYGRTTGIYAFISEDPLLKSKYKTLMRYKNLAEKIRKAVGIVPVLYSENTPGYNLLWALSPTLPDDICEYDEEMIEIYQDLRKLYLSFTGMNFKQIHAKLEE